jgi:hypothetical protein
MWANGQEFEPGGTLAAGEGHDLVAAFAGGLDDRLDVGTVPRGSAF